LKQEFGSLAYAERISSFVKPQLNISVSLLFVSGLLGTSCIRGKASRSLTK
jgi:hypothetical protein